MNQKIGKDEIKNYLKTEVEIMKNKETETGPELHMENIKYQNSFSDFDKFFPFHVFLKTGEKVPRMDIEFLCTYRYLYFLRYEFVNVLNKKYTKYLNAADIQKLKDIEFKYSMLNFTFYFSAVYLLFKRPIKFAKLLNFYLGGYLIFASKYYSIYIVRNDFKEIKNKIKMHKNININDNDVYDYTLIPDWRTYLYFYRIL